MAEINDINVRYPNLSLLFTDIFKNGAQLANEVAEIHEKVEILKELLVQAGVIHIQVQKSEAKPQPVEEVRINDILWFNAVDEDLPN